MTTEPEVFACEIAGDNYGLSLEGYEREYLKGRLHRDERKSFNAGWEAAKQYYQNQVKVPDVQS